MANAPLTLRFGSDTSGLDGAKKGVASLAASIATNMASVAGTALTAGRAVASASQTAINAFQTMRTVSAMLPTAIFAIGTAFATLKVAEAAIDGVKQQLALLLSIADKSKERGISAEFFQAFMEGAKGAEDRVKSFEGALTQAFQATKDVLNPNWTVWDQGLTKVTAIETALRGMRELFSTDQKFTGLDLFRGAQNQDQRIMAVLTAMKELNNIGQKTAALDLGERMFGAEFADRIRRGQESVDKLLETIQRKITSPDIISSDTVTRAKELDDRLNDAWRTIAERIKPDWDDLGNIALRIKGAWTEIIEAVARYKIDSAKAPPLPGSTAPSNQDAQNNPDPNAAAFANPAILNQGRRRRGQVPISSAAAPQSPSGAAQGDAMSQLWDYTGSEPPKPDPIPLPTRRPLDAPKPPPVAAKEGLDQIETFINRLQRSTEVLKVEIEMEGKSNAEKERGIALVQAAAAARAAGRDLTDEEIRKIDALSTAHARLADKLKDVQQAQRGAAETARFFGSTAADAMADVWVDGQKADDVVRNLTKSLARAALQAAFTGQGPLAFLMGTAPLASAGGNAVGGLAGGLSKLFSGFRAGGGDVQAGRAYKVGETGEELFVPGQNGRIVPIDRNGASGGNTFAPTYSIDARGSTMTESQFRAILAENNARVLRQAGAIAPAAVATTNWRFR